MIFIHPASHYSSIESISQMCFISVCVPVCVPMRVPMRVPVRVPVCAYACAYACAFRVPSIHLALDQLFQP
jgi:hypothetical protein